MIVILHAYRTWTEWYGQLGILTNNNHIEFTQTGKLIDHFISNFSIGVDVFFLLSGFLITYILIEEKKCIGKINIKHFIIRRSLRIWPLYFILIILSPFLIKWVSEVQPDYFSSTFFYTNFYIIKTHNWAYPFSHFWSICIEEHFYLIWPFIIALVPLKKLLPTFISVIILSIISRFIITYLYSDPKLPLYLNTFCRIDVLVIGAIGAHYYSIRPFLFQLNFFTKFLLYILLCFFLFLEPFNFLNIHFAAAFEKYFSISIISVLLLDYNFNPTIKFRFIGNSIFNYLGKISYGIYMISNILLPIIVKKIMWELHSSNLYLFIFFVLSLSILVPIISFELIEKQFLKLGARFKVMETKSY